MSETTIENEVITVTYVNPKSKFPKFNNGSVKLDNGEWYNVSKDVSIAEFKANRTYSVDVETNEKGYKSIVSVNKKSENGYGTNSENNATTIKTETKQKQYDTKVEDKDRRISRQGVIQAAVQSLFVQDFDQAVVLANKMLEFVHEKQGQNNVY